MSTVAAFNVAVQIPEAFSEGSLPDGDEVSDDGTESVDSQRDIASASCIAVCRSCCSSVSSGASPPFAASNAAPAVLSASENAVSAASSADCAAFTASVADPNAANAASLSDVMLVRVNNSSASADFRAWFSKSALEATIAAATR